MPIRVTYNDPDGGGGGFPCGAVNNLQAVAWNADQNNVALTATDGYRRSVAGANDIRLSGIVAPPAGVDRCLVIANDTDKKIDLRHQDVASVAANRFHLPDLGDYEIKKGAVSPVIVYDHTLNRWRLISGHH